MIPMTKITGVPHKHDAHPGMAYFPDTGPYATTCGDCALRVRGRCEKYREMTGRLGGVLKKLWHSCKYFTRKT